jgi:hypothetical protein
LLVIDEDIDNRVATELKARGREAVAVSELLLRGLKDEPLLRALVARFEAPITWVFVSGDDAMPDDHRSVLDELRVTLATIDPRRPPGTREAAWRRDVIHRWAHAMSVQERARSVVTRSIVTAHGGRVELAGDGDRVENDSTSCRIVLNLST